MCCENSWRHFLENDFSREKKRAKANSVMRYNLFLKMWGAKSSHLRFLLKFHFISFRCFSFRQYEETSRLLPTLNKQKGNFLLCHFMFHFQFHYSFYKLSQCAFKAFFRFSHGIDFSLFMILNLLYVMPSFNSEWKFEDNYKKVVKSFTIALTNFHSKFSLELFKFFFILILENSASPSHH